MASWKNNGARTSFLSWLKSFTRKNWYYKYKNCKLNGHSNQLNETLFFSLCNKDVWWTTKALMQIIYLRCLSSSTCSELFVVTMHGKVHFGAFGRLKYSNYKGLIDFNVLSWPKLSNNFLTLLPSLSLLKLFPGYL